MIVKQLHHLNPIAGYALITETKYRVNHIDSSLGDLKTHTSTERFMTLKTRYEGLCYISPNIPLLVGSNITTLYLPPGRHTIVFYTYFRDFNIDLTVHVDASRCTGIINSCGFCRRRNPGFLIAK